MGDYERTGSVQAPAQQLFDFLAQVRNLPRYFARMTRAEPAAGDAVQVEAVVPGGGHQEGEAWFTVDEQARRITWGSERDKDYSGELSVDGDESHSTVTITLHTARAGGDIDDSLAESIANIRRLVEDGDAPKA